ncbi:MAG: helix-turn-helix domain-containing protein [bacterium]|nr:helix-turn-helix domain-containing protein [bacterium]
MNINKPDYKFYGKKLKEIRKAKKLTVNELANLVDRSPRTVGSWERGERRPSSSDIKIMAVILGIDLSEISNITFHSTDFKRDKLLNEVLSTEDKLYDLFGSNLNIEQKAFLYKIIGIYKNLGKTVELTKMENEGFRLIIDTIPLGVYSKDQFRRYKLANRAFSYVTGSSISDISGKTDEQVLPKLLREPIRVIENKVLSTGKPIFYTNVTFDEMAYKRYFTVSVIPILENKNIVTSLIGCIADATERMNSTKNYKLLENVISNIATALWVRYRKPVPRLVFLNNAIEGIFEKSINDITNNPGFLLNCIHPDDQLGVKIWSDDFLKNSSSTINETSKVYRIFTPDGIEKIILDKRSRFINEDGELVDHGAIKEITKEGYESYKKAITNS